MVQFRIRHLLAVTAYASLIASLIQLGEFGQSIVPVMLSLSLFLIPYAFRFSHCPSILKARVHLGFSALVATMLMPNMLYEFGWWRLPINLAVVFLAVPATLVIVQLLKNRAPDSPNIELRLTQIVVIWLPIAMLLLASCFGTHMPLVLGWHR